MKENPKNKVSLESLDKGKVYMFIGILTLLLALAFEIQKGFLEKLESEHLLVKAVFSYAFHLVFGIAVFIFFYFRSVKYVNNLGYFFLGVSMLKFVVYYFAFRPFYMGDGHVDRKEFALFFVPYAVSLTVEVIYMIRILNRMKFN